MTDSPNLEKQTEQFRASFTRVRDEMMKMMVGQKSVVEGVLVAFFAGGHVLLEGVPGLGKTYLVKVLARVLGLAPGRVQCTPDLMPSDILGTHIVGEDATGRRVFRFERGPVFANLLLVDEINRATPKTQSALLEVMQERAVTIASERHVVPLPFFVLATQNPIEMEGTYPLPEAQLDRFFFKLKVAFPTADDLHTILDRTTAREHPEIRKVLASPQEVVELREVVRQVPLAKDVQTHAINLVLATHPSEKQASPLAKKYVRYGASPRGAQALILAGKIHALLDNRYHVSRADIDQAAPAALRHRILLNFEGEAEGTNTDEVIAEILKQYAG